MQRYFAQAKQENRFLLAPEDWHHIKNVMRMKEQDRIEVVAQERLYLCEIVDMQQEIIEGIEPLVTPSEILNSITLAIPLLKEQKMDFILQKATELGVATIALYEAKNSIVRLDSSKLAKKYLRWEKILKEASEQSKRQTIPKLLPLMPLQEIATLDGTKIVCSTVEQERNLKFFLQSQRKCDKLVIVIGPEGGLTLEEEQYLNRQAFTSVSLGPRIMRVETVPIYILSILNYESME